MVKLKAYNSWDNFRGSKLDYQSYNSSQNRYSHSERWENSPPDIGRMVPYRKHKSWVEAETTKEEGVEAREVEEMAQVEVRALSGPARRNG